MRRLIHDAEVELKTQQQIVVHLQAGCSENVVLIKGLLDLLHRLKHLIRFYVSLDGLIHACDVVGDSNEVVKSRLFKRPSTLSMAEFVKETTSTLCLIAAKILMRTTIAVVLPEPGIPSTMW